MEREHSGGNDTFFFPKNVLEWCRNVWLWCHYKWIRQNGEKQQMITITLYNCEALPVAVKNSSIPVFGRLLNSFYWDGWDVCEN